MPTTHRCWPSPALASRTWRRSCPGLSHPKAMFLTAALMVRGRGHPQEGGAGPAVRGRWLEMSGQPVPLTSPLLPGCRGGVRLPDRV